MKEISLFFVLILFISCSVKDGVKRDVDVLLLSTKQVVEYAPLSEVTSSATLIALQTNDDILIKEIRGVKKSGVYYFVSDRRTLYRFDTNGGFVDKLNKTGGGPEEYLQITDFQVDSVGDIWVLSRGSKSIYKYSSSYEFQEKISFSYWVDNIKLLDNDTMVLYIGNETDGDNTDQIKLLSLSQQQIIGGFLEIDSNKAQYLHVRSKNHFSYTEEGDQLCFFQLFNDTVYKLSHEGLEPYWFLDIDNKNVPERFFESKYDNVMSFFQELFKYSYAYGTEFYLESKNNYWCSFFYNKECYMTSVPKVKEGSMMIFTGIKEDIHLYNYPIKLGEVDMFIQHDNQLIIPIFPFNIMEYAEEFLSESSFADLGIISEDQNPVLLQVEFK